MNYIAYGLHPVRQGTSKDKIKQNIREIKEYIHEVEVQIQKDERTVNSLKLRLEKNNEELLRQIEMLEQRKTKS
jgi:hypothetical protein